MHSIRIIFLILLGMFSSCNFGKTFEPPEATQRFALDFIALFQTGDIQKAKQLLDPAEQTSDSVLSDIAKLLSVGNPLATKLVGSQMTTYSDEKSVALSYEVQFSQGWRLVEILVHKSHGKQMVRGFRVTPLEKSLEQLTAFSFEGVSIIHWIIFSLCVFVATFSLTAAVVCIRSKIRMKWLWFFFTLLGFGKVFFSWGTSGFDFQIFGVQLLGVSAMKAGGFGQWIISFSIPVGAILFLAMRKKLIALSTPPVAPVAKSITTAENSDNPTV